MRTTVVPISTLRDRDPRLPRLARAIDARRQLDRPSGRSPSGRVWLNGRELGDPDPRYAHLDHPGD